MLSLVVFDLVEKALELPLRRLELAFELGYLLLAVIDVAPRLEELPRELGQLSLDDRELGVPAAESLLKHPKAFVLRRGFLAENQELAGERRAPRVPARLFELPSKALELLLELGDPFGGNFAGDRRGPRSARERRLLVEVREDGSGLGVEELGEPGLDRALRRSRLFHRVGCDGGHRLLWRRVHGLFRRGDLLEPLVGNGLRRGDPEVLDRFAKLVVGEGALVQVGLGVDFQLLMELQIGGGDARGHERHRDPAARFLDSAEKTVAFLLGKVHGDEHRLGNPPSQGFEDAVLSMGCFHPDSERGKERGQTVAELRVLVDDQYCSVRHRSHGECRFFGTGNRIPDQRGRIER